MFRLCKLYRNFNKFRTFSYKNTYCYQWDPYIPLTNAVSGLTGTGIMISIDANETITVAGTPGIGPYTASITPPAGTISGPVRMRIRITYTDPLDPCGFNSFGEVEDYTINLIGPNYWVGGFNNYWHQALNWSAGHIPTEDEDVIINNTGFQPVYIDDYPGFTNEACHNFNIGSGAQVQVWDMILNVNGSMNIDGALSMTDATGVINVKGLE